MWLALSAAAFLVFYWLQAAGWWLLLRGFALEAPLGWASHGVGPVHPCRYVPGNVFMFVGRAVLSHTRGLDLDRVSATMVYEQALQFCAALVTLGVLFPFWDYHPGLAAISLLGVPVLLVLLHPRVFRPSPAACCGWPVASLWGPCFPTRPCSDCSATIWLRGCSSVRAPGSCSRASPRTRGPGSSPETILAYAFAYVAGMLAFVFPSGVGVREAVLAGSLGKELGPGWPSRGPSCCGYGRSPSSWPSLAC